MTIDLTCQKCETSFEVDAQELIDGTEKLICPQCHARAPAGTAEDFVSALAEMRAQVGALGKKFAVSMELESEDLEEELDAKKSDEDDDEMDFEEDDLEDEEEDLEDEDMEEG